MFDVVVFEDPDVLAEFGGVSVFSVAEWKHRKTQKLHRTQQAHLDPQRQQHQALSFISWHILSSPFCIVLDTFAERGISEGWTNQDYNGITDWLTTVYI